LRDAAKAVLVENVDRGVLFSQKESKDFYL